jgi:hypothetical protein
MFLGPTRPVEADVAAHARTIGMAALMAGVLALGGCASSYYSRPVVPQPVTVKQIVTWSKDGVAPEEIIRRMRNSRTVYRLKASQLAELKNEGVSDQVIDYMQRTYLAAVRRSARLENWNYWHLYGGYWYGGVPFGWPYDWYWPDDFYYFDFDEHGGHEGHEGHGGHDSGRF